VQKITPEGSITTVAGVFEWGNGGCDGDGGPPVSAQLSSPSGVALDSEGNLLVVDTHNHRVQKISPTGVITTIGGTGTWCAGGDFSGDGGPAVLAQLQEPKGIAIDPADNVLAPEISLSPIPTTIVSAWYLLTVRSRPSPETEYLVSAATAARHYPLNSGVSEAL
jgi:DNA-binding beta-propeller fold protein YncE